MFFNIKSHFKYFFSFFIFFILISCQLQDPDKNHGILFLENRSKSIVEKISNKNDVISVLGQPHVKSTNSIDTWIYVERTLSKGKFHKFGKHVLKTNNTLVLEFNKFGILNAKSFYDKEDIKKIRFSKAKTENRLTKNSFVENFLQSIKQKMYGKRN